MVMDRTVNYREAADEAAKVDSSWALRRLFSKGVIATIFNVQWRAPNA